MIQVQKLRIEEFRGIRDLDLTMGSSSFVVVGPNGSGKSGVVDAIDFALTGNVARLSGAGTGGISVAKHAPHVHQRDNPAAASVTLTFTHPASGLNRTGFSGESGVLPRRLSGKGCGQRSRPARTRWVGRRGTRSGVVAGCTSRPI